MAAGLHSRAAGQNLWGVFASHPTGHGGRHLAQRLLPTLEVVGRQLLGGSGRLPVGRHAEHDLLWVVGLR